jgi:hypothetical protein
VYVFLRYTNVDLRIRAAPAWAARPGAVRRPAHLIRRPSLLLLFVRPLASNLNGMDPVHHLTIEADNGMDVLFVCPAEGCGRRVVVRRSGDLIVLDKGDFYALHVGGTNGLEISSVVPRNRRASA